MPRKVQLARTVPIVDPPAAAETWVVVAGDWARPVYWAGCGWSGNRDHAVQLLRRVDANRVAANMELAACDWDVPPNVRAAPLGGRNLTAMVRGLGAWRVIHGGRDNPQ